MDQYELYREANQEGVIRYLDAPKGKSFDQWVTKDSEHWQRKFFVNLNRYFFKESKHAQDLDESDNAWQNIEFYSFTKKITLDDREKNCLIGSVRFYIDPVNKKTELGTCWIHPFHRNRGHFKKAWPEFKDRHPDFIVSDPNKAMEAIVERLNLVSKT